MLRLLYLQYLSNHSTHKYEKKYKNDTLQYIREIRKLKTWSLFMSNGLSRANWAWWGLTELKSTCVNAHTQKSLWRKCCLTVHEQTHQLGQEEGSTARDIAGCPPTVNSGAAAWTDGLGQVAAACPGSLCTHPQARRWKRWEGVLASPATTSRRGAAAAGFNGKRSPLCPKANNNKTANGDATDPRTARLPVVKENGRTALAETSSSTGVF